MPTSPNNQFVEPSNPVLIQTAAEILPGSLDSAETKADIERMLGVAYGEQTDRQKPLLVGLAAPQIGISKRIILVDVSADGHGKVGDLRVYLNPKITWQSDEESEWYEACYSTANVCGIVSRPQAVKIEANNSNGELVSEEHQGYTARIFQHEVDHLDGKEFVSHITDDQKLHWVEDGEFPLYRDKEAWRDWAVKCPRSKWEAIKRPSK